MEFKDTEIKIYKCFRGANCSEKQYKQYIAFLDLGIEYIFHDGYFCDYDPEPQDVFINYKITNEKKWAISRLKYGI